LERGSKTPDPFLDAEKIRAATAVRYVEIHDTLGSTNQRAVELARDPQIDLPALVVTRLQTAGKGRGGNTWWAADGALTFSLLLDSATTGIAPVNWPQLSLATAVAVCDALADSITRRAAASPPPVGHIGVKDEPARSDPPQLQIKWPNDVLLLGRKVCGILLESPAGASATKDRLIIGIGININNSWHDAPHEILTSGTAISDYSGGKYDLCCVLVCVLKAVAKRIDQLQCHDVELIHAWQRRNYLAGRRVVVEGNGSRIEGDCEGIAADGALVVNATFGRQRIYSGSVRLA